MTDLQRSEWFPPGSEPWQDGVYEVEFVPDGAMIGFARYWATPPAGFVNHWSGWWPTAEHAARAQRPAGPSRPRWRGITREAAQVAAFESSRDAQPAQPVAV